MDIEVELPVQLDRLPPPLDRVATDKEARMQHAWLHASLQVYQPAVRQHARHSCNCTGLQAVLEELF